ncbi:MAG: TetR family transcriptional regulator [Acidimicrobiales bacterium]|nr:TetR family transcriptional regulator [Acidimicrobiales bacterium]
MAATMNEDLGRRERKKQQTRDELIAAAAKLFAERGFDETTTADIADAADVSQRTFFRHFSSKEAVLYGNDEELADAFYDAIMARPARETPVTAVSAALGMLAGQYAASPERTFLQGQLAARYPSVSAYSRAVVQRGLERKVVEAVAQRMGVDPLDDPQPEVIAGAAMSALRFALRKWVASNGTLDLLDLAAKALTSLR